MAHNTIITVMDALPAREKDLWKRERENLARTYTYYPDLYAGGAARVKKAIQPYARKINGRDFHYFPVEQETFEGVGSWQTDMTGKWRFTMQGLHYYLAAVTGCLKEGRITPASRFLGWLCHVLQDQGAFFHSLEGPEGTHPFVFNILFAAPPDRPYLNPTVFLHEDAPQVSMTGYKPALLGTTVAEAGFHLFQRLMAVKRHNRRLLIPLIQSGYANDKLKESRIRKEIALKVSEMLMDLLHTVFCIGTGALSPAEVAGLAEIDVSGLCPVQYPNHLSPPYRFTPVIRNSSLDDSGCPAPLMLNEHGRKIRYTTGLGTGCHRQYVIAYGIPGNVYRWFEAGAGLHAELGAKGRVEIAVYLNRDEVFRKVFRGSRTAEHLKIDVRKGGILRLQASAANGKWSNPYNHVVWAEPRLIRNRSG